MPRSDSVFSWVSPFVIVMAAVGCSASSPTTGQPPGPPSEAPPAPAAAAAPDASVDDATAPSPEQPEASVDAAPPPPPPDIVLGNPITAPDGVWTDVPFPQAYCRDGTSAHIAVHLNSASKKVAIYEEGGGACFNDTSCKLMTFDVNLERDGTGIFNFKNPDNPIADWNIFYIPYCTGDVHAGDNAAGIPGPLTGKTHYSGYSNLRIYLARILATVESPTDLLLTGSSAGGFGAALTADLVGRNLPASVERYTVLDDSGPPMPTEYVPPCLQFQWSNVWGFKNTVLKDCGEACADPSDFVRSYVQFMVGKYFQGPSSSRYMAGLISSTGDSTMSMFFGFGAQNCTSAVPTPLTSMQYAAGLADIRSSLQASTDRFGTYYVDSSAHTRLMFDTSSALLGGVYDTSVGGVKLTDWIRDLLAHKQAPHIGP